jgi:tRNA-2-methylthio-N6-dimethylallyladenosine synthase
LLVSTETEQDHQDTLSLMEYVKYNFGYMYSYSNVREHWQEEKWEMTFRRNKEAKLQEIVDLQTKTRLVRSEEFIGQTVEVLVESFQKNRH